MNSQGLLWLWLATCVAHVAKGGFDQSRTRGSAGVLGFVSTAPDRWSQVTLVRSRHSAQYSSGRCILMKDPRDSFKKKQKARKGKKDGGDSEGSPEGAAAMPVKPRVDPKLGSVRSQIKFANHVKDIERSMSSGGSFKSSNRYRRSKEEAIEELNARKQGKGDPDRTVWFPEGDWFVMVDGYNIIGQYPRYKKLRDKNMDMAREALVGDLKELASMRSWMMDVVFDSYNTGTEASRSKVSSNVAVVFTGGKDSADTYMERLAIDLQLAGTTAFAAATSDRMIMDQIKSHGGIVMSGNRFVQEIKRCKKEAEELASAVQKNLQNKASSKDDARFDNRPDVPQELLDQIQRAILQDSESGLGGNAYKEPS